MDNSGAARSRSHRRYIEWDNSAAVAARIVTTIFERADNLAKFPHLGRPGRIPDTRELVVVDTPFIVPYRVHDAEVEILAVFHGARQWAQPAKSMLDVRD